MPRSRGAHSRSLIPFSDLIDLASPERRPEKKGPAEQKNQWRGPREREDRDLPDESITGSREMPGKGCEQINGNIARENKSRERDWA